MCDDFFDDFGWEEMAMAGALSEEMTEEEKEHLRLEREMMKDEEGCPCCSKEYNLFNPLDSDPFP